MSWAIRSKREKGSWIGPDAEELWMWVRRRERYEFSTKSEAVAFKKYIEVFSGATDVAGIVRVA